MSTAVSINKVTEPVVEILKDNSALLAVAAILEAAGFIDVIPASVVQAISAGAYSTLEGVLAALEASFDAADSAIDAAIELTEDAAEIITLTKEKASGAQKTLSRVWATSLWLAYALVPGSQAAVDLAGDYAPSWSQGAENPFGIGR